MEVINSYPELAAAVNVMAPFPVRLTVIHGPPQLHQVELTVTTTLPVAPLDACGMSGRTSPRRRPA